MEINLKVFFGAFISIMVFTNGLALTFIYSTPDEDITKEVPCYDKNSNEIKDLVCYKEIEGMSPSEKLFGAITTLIISIIFALAMGFGVGSEYYGVGGEY